MAKNFVDAIKEYLDKRANDDELFAAKYIGSKKTVKECCAYIMQRARKEASNGSAVIADEVVYGWAVHFYQEDDIKAEMTANIAARVSVGTDKPAKVAKAQNAPKKAKKADDDQPLLFSFDD